MKWSCTLICLLFVFAAGAQSLTGIWRGYFVQKNLNPFTGKFTEDRYKYEVQLQQQSNNACEGVTYSYKTTVFYGKAALKGIFSKKTKNLTIKETKMLDLKIQGLSEPCLMTCYLEYSKVGKVETLTGDYSSINTNTKEDCGNGYVYLERVEDTDFEKEDFLVNKKKEKTVPQQPATPPITAKKSPATKKATPATPQKTTPASKYKPGAEDALVKKEDNTKKVTIDTLAKAKKPEVAIEPPPLPKELTERTNTLVKKLYVPQGQLKIDLYDNGEIDDDSITVYHNGVPVIEHGRLSSKAISVTVDIDADHPTHELVMVANNLGRIPPNTALMVITAPGKRYEVFLTSDNQRNAKIVFEYKPQGSDKK